MKTINVAPVVPSRIQNALTSAKSGEGKLDGPSFGDWLKRSIQEVDQMQENADSAARQLVSGENKGIHGTMIAMQKAGVAMDLMLEVRNKIIAAYDEIKRMQI